MFPFFIKILLPATLLEYFIILGARKISIYFNSNDNLQEILVMELQLKSRSSDTHINKYSIPPNYFIQLKFPLQIHNVICLLGCSKIQKNNYKLQLLIN
jgi:hypothetical protein